MDGRHKSSQLSGTVWTRERIEQRVSEFGEWFHNLDLDGVRTAPDRFLGDYPAVKWRQFAEPLPDDLRKL